MSVDDPDWRLDPSQVVEMALDDLALEVLRNVASTDEWNEHNWIQGAYNDSRWRREPAALRAFAEAFGWLRSQGLIARTPGQSAADAIFVTRKGVEALKRDAAWVRAVQRIDVDLHPQLQVEARPHILRGDHASAILAAMRAVEIAVRHAAGLPNSLVGVALMQQAFKVGGPLHDPEAEPGESQARMNLYAAAIGMFKNPSSHRKVDYPDTTEAVEIVLLADLLLRLLDRA